MNDEIKCPYCGAEMTRGKISADGRAPIQYSDEDEPLPIIDVIKENSRHFIVGKSKLFGSAMVECLICKKCRKIIINYGKE